MQQLWLNLGAAFASWPGPCVAIGNFDGVHRGHQALVSTAVARAREAGGTAVVLTFDPHPARVLTPTLAPAALTTLGQKAELLEGLGAQALVVLPFDAALARLEPAEFVGRVLADALRARRVIVGTGFRFGHRQAGDVALLGALAGSQGFVVEAIEPVRERGEPISSSRVREVLGRGGVEHARDLLGRAYAIDGVVVKGDGRGRSIGVPTANLAPVNEVVPARGVYAARCRVARSLSVETAAAAWLPAVVNVGERPTFGGRGTTIEAHLVGFGGDLYGATVRLAFEARLRDERRFPGKTELVAQIREDIRRAEGLLRHADGAERPTGDEPLDDGV